MYNLKSYVFYHSKEHSETPCRILSVIIRVLSCHLHEKSADFSIFSQQARLDVSSGDLRIFFCLSGEHRVNYNVFIYIYQQYPGF